MINLVFDSPEDKLNVWDFKGHCNFYDKFSRNISWIYQYFTDQINVITPEQIDTVDDFIYPVSMNDPYILCRQLIHNRQQDYGFWSRVDNRVIKSLRQGKGRIIIEANNEPLLSCDLADLKQSLKDTTTFPNDKIHLIIDDLDQIDNINFHDFPKMWEAIYANEAYWQNISTSINKPNWRIFDLVDGTQPDLVTKQRNFCCFNRRSVKHSAAYYLPLVLDKLALLQQGWISLDDYGKDYLHRKDRVEDVSRKFDVLNFKTLHTEDIKNALDIKKTYELVNFEVVVEAYFSLDFINYPFLSEKIFRPLGIGLPFILVGQAYSLKNLHKRGYRTFHPLIDESYDLESDDLKRFFMAVREIKKLCNTDPDKLKSLINYTNSTVYPHNVSVAQERMKRFGEFLGVNNTF